MNSTKILRFVIGVLVGCEVFFNAALPIGLAESYVIEGEGSYVMNERKKDSPDRCKKYAAEAAKQDAFTRAGVYITSQTVIKDSQLDKDTVRAIAAHLLRVEERRFFVTVGEMGKLTYHCHIVATVDDDELNKALQKYSTR